MLRSAQAIWQGNITEGKGTLSTQSGALKSVPYSFKMRFDNTPGTNPEELIAAAHAGCFTMACSAFLTRAGFPPETLSTQANVHLTKVNEGWNIDQIDLILMAKVPNITTAEFDKITQNAKENCPVSQLFKAKITLDAQLGP